MQNKKQNKVNVQITKNASVKHARFISVLQAQAQNNANAHLYTSAQLTQASALVQAMQAQYFSKVVYKNLRKKFITIKVANAQICNNTLLIAKKFNAKVVVTECNSVVLRLFA